MPQLEAMAESLRPKAGDSRSRPPGGALALDRLYLLAIHALIRARVQRAQSKLLEIIVFFDSFLIRLVKRKRA